MSQSATTSRRSERKAATASRLTTLARRLTAEGGLAGWTIEELCDEVGVSRRTFFNYFPSKEDAVLGIDEDGEGRRLTEEFLALGSRGWPAVVDDILALAVEHARGAGIDVAQHSAEHADFHAALEREPRLLARFMGATREREQEFAALVARREGVATDDPHVQALVLLLSALLRSAGDRLLAEGAQADFAGILTQTLAAIRTVAANPASAPRKDRP